MKYKELYQIANDIVDEANALDRFTDEMDADGEVEVPLGVIDDIAGFLDSISNLIQKFQSKT